MALLVSNNEEGMCDSETGPGNVYRHAVYFPNRDVLLLYYVLSPMPLCIFFLIALVVNVSYIVCYNVGTSEMGYTTLKYYIQTSVLIPRT